VTAHTCQPGTVRSMNDAKKDYHPYVQGGDRTPCDRCGKALPGAYIRWSDKKVLCGLCYIKLPD
jgi:hypothetical protein